MFLIRYYLRLSSCCNNKKKARMSENRKKWLSKGEPSRVDTRAFVFASPSVSLWSRSHLNSLCQRTDRKLGLSLNADTFVIFLFAPTHTPTPLILLGWGCVWWRGLLHSYAAHGSKKNTAEWPTIASACSFPASDPVRFTGTLFKNKSISCFAAGMLFSVPLAGWYERVVVRRGFECPLRGDQKRCVLEETSRWKWNQAPGFLFGDLTDEVLPLISVWFCFWVFFFFFGCVL